MRQIQNTSALYELDRTAVRTKRCMKIQVGLLCVSAETGSSFKIERPDIRNASVQRSSISGPSRKPLGSPKRSSFGIEKIYIIHYVGEIHQNGEGNRSGEYRPGENAF